MTVKDDNWFNICYHDWIRNDSYLFLSSTDTYCFALKKKYVYYYEIWILWKPKIYSTCFLEIICQLLSLNGIKQVHVL